MDLKDALPINKWGKNIKKPFVIAGPCSAETPEQLLSTALELKKLNVDALRAGIWKPRTRPNGFEGMGIEALKWVKDVKAESGLPFATEVGSALHVEVALKYGCDILWIGARTTVNPFSVQEIADSLKGVDIPVLVKNPMNPDINLWIGALERIHNAGISKVGAIHRGFSSFEKTKFRNTPNWQIPFELKRQFPDLALLCDPSHIGGTRDLIFDISQRALDFDYDGLIIESHINPDEAWSDASQQVTPARLAEILSELKYKTESSDNVEFISQLEQLRNKINNIDKDLIDTLAQRMIISEKIGEYKKVNSVTTYQNERWIEIFNTRKEWARKLNVSEEFVADIFKLVHEESVRKQEEIINNEITKA